MEIKDKNLDDLIGPHIDTLYEIYEYSFPSNV